MPPRNKEEDRGEHEERHPVAYSTHYVIHRQARTVTAYLVARFDTDGLHVHQTAALGALAREDPGAMLTLLTQLEHELRAYADRVRAYHDRALELAREP